MYKFQYLYVYYIFRNDMKAKGSLHLFFLKINMFFGNFLPMHFSPLCLAGALGCLPIDLACFEWGMEHGAGLTSLRLASESNHAPSASQIFAHWRYFICLPDSEADNS